MDCMSLIKIRKLLGEILMKAMSMSRYSAKQC
jgi:hypothetical protein